MTNPKHHPLSKSGDARVPRYVGETIRPKSGESYDWHTHDFGQLISAALGIHVCRHTGKRAVAEPGDGIVDSAER